MPFPAGRGIALGMLRSLVCNRSWLLVSAFLLVPLQAAAEEVYLDEGEVESKGFTIDVVNRVIVGQGSPVLVVRVEKPALHAQLTLRRSDGAEVRQKSGKLRAGGEHTFSLPTPVGVWQLTGAIAVTFEDGSKPEMPLNLEVETAPPLVLEVSKEEINLEAGEVTFRFNRPAGYCEYEVAMEDRPLRKGKSNFNGEPPGTPLAVRWRKYNDGDVVLRIRLECWGVDGQLHAGRELSPWSLDVPHEEVTFASGRFEIQESEESKLTRALADIDTAVRRYGASFPVQLFVVGHTDTVGDSGSNRTLSLQRAKAISTYFRRHGVRVPIQYAGFGEGRLAVETPDETDEVRNRRAQYIIAMEAPFAADWAKVP